MGQTTNGDPKIFAALMLKNEAHSIKSTLESVINHIDGVVILDTGSTDETISTVIGITSSRDVPVHVCTSEFVDFSTTRNVLLENIDNIASAMGADIWAVLLDADDRIVAPHLMAQRLKAHPKERLLSVTLSLRGMQWAVPRVYRSGSMARYKGKVHEVLGLPFAAVVKHSGINIVHVVTHARSLESTKNRLEWDERMLRQELELNPEDSRSWFYLGQTLENLERWQDAYDAYGSRAKIDVFQAEKYEAKFRMARVRSRMNGFSDIATVQDLYLKAYAYRPFRAEPLFAIASEYWEASKKENDIAKKKEILEVCLLFAFAAASKNVPQEEGLFVDMPIYIYQAHALVLACLQNGAGSKSMWDWAMQRVATMAPREDFYTKSLGISECIQAHRDGATKQTA